VILLNILRFWFPENMAESKKALPAVSKVRSKNISFQCFAYFDQESKASGSVMYNSRGDTKAIDASHIIIVL
jgi:hypothetical protein